MRSRYAAPTAAIGVVAALALAVGGLTAARRGPQDAGTTSAAAPLPADGEAEARVRIDLTGLRTGRSPQLTYLSGRTVLGGGGSSFPVPPGAVAQRVVRHGLGLWLLSERRPGKGADILEVPDPASGQEVVRIADAASLVAGTDGVSVAYATQRLRADGTPLRGGKVVYDGQYPEKGLTLNRPKDYRLRALSLHDMTVVFSASPAPDGRTTRLYSWNVRTGKVVAVPGVAHPAVPDVTGSVAVVAEQSGRATCSAYVDLRSGLRRWRTCDYQPSEHSDSVAFTPAAGSVVLRAPSADWIGDRAIAVLRARDGTLIREWSGPQFRGFVAEDDDHLLLRVHQDEQSAVVRCAISTGDCELATRPGRGDLLLGV